MSGLSSRSHASTTDANASLISITSKSSIVEAGAVEQPPGRVDRTGEHQHRVDADEALVDDAGTRPQPELAARGRGRQQHRGRAVGDLRRRAGGVHAVLAGDRLQLRERLERRLAQAFVARDVMRRAGRLAFLVDVGRVDRQRPRARSGPRPTPAARAPATRGRTASVSARVMPHLSAMRSAPSNCDVSS